VNRLRHTVASTLVGAVAALTFATPAAADPIRDAEWHLGFLNVAEAHKYSQGDGVVVGVVDTGVDAGHPDLARSVLAGKDFSNSGGDGRTDTNGHGTAMAGLIAAHGRTLGLAPKAQILPVRKGVGSVDAGPSDQSIDWAVDNGAKVLCLAFGQKSSPLLRTAIDKAVASDVVVIAGVGNAPYPASEAFPAGYPGVVGAAGVDRNGNHAAISVVSPFAVLAAPAVDIASTDTRVAGRTGYRTGSGTSDATAIIAGAAALVRAKYPNLSATEVIHRLTATADDKGTPGRDNEYGYGVINLVKALTADVPPLQPTTTPTTSAPTQAAPPADNGGLPAKTVLIVGALLIVAALCAGFITIALRQRAR
jgi:type VII secretion-associated serine protease mycosin